MLRSPWLAGLSLLALTACAAPPPAETTAETPVAEPAPVAVEIEQPAEPEPVVIETETETVIENAIAALTEPDPPVAEPPVIEAAPTPKMKDEPEELNDDPEQLMDLAGAALESLLGAPGYTRVDADAEVWQYLGAGCVLDIYLYRAGEGAPHTVAYYEFRGEADERLCLRTLLLAQAR